VRDISGQVNQFSFQSLSQGVNDPGLGSDVEKIFLQKWQQELNVADQSVKPAGLKLLVAGIETAVPQALTKNGDEHLGASYSRMGQLGEIQDDVSLPAGASFGFSFSVDTIVDRLNAAW
jgi:hypothetical protein